MEKIYEMEKIQDEVLTEKPDNTEYEEAKEKILSMEHICGNRENTITAFALTDNFNFDPKTQWEIKPMPRKRKWMDDTGWYAPDGTYHSPHAYKCLPMVTANTMGWTIGCPVGFTVTWNGSLNPLGAISFKFDENPELWSQTIIERFGVGTFTIPVPYIFRTPSDTQLMFRNPSNAFKDNAVALDAVIETDWLPYPIFHSWKIKRPNEPVRFEKGEPFTMIHPVKLKEIKDCDFEVTDIDQFPELRDEYQQWGDERREFQHLMNTGDPATGQTAQEWRDEHGDWQKQYTKGEFKENIKVEHHYPTLGSRETKGCPFGFGRKKKNKDK